MFYQNGNILFIILITILLFASLSYAVSSSSRTSGSGVSKEKARLDAAELQQRLSAIKSSYDRLRIGGCSFDKMSTHFDQDNDGSYTDNDAAEFYYNPKAPSDLSCHLFHPNGGGLVKPLFRLNMLQPYNAAWGISDRYGMVYFTTFMRMGGIGADAARDLIGVVYGVPKETCMTYNDMLSIPNDGANPPAGRIYHDNGGKFKGNISTYGAGSHTAVTSPMYGQTTGCVAGSGGNHHIFIVLQAF